MARVKGGYASKQRHKRVLKQAKGYFGSKHLLYKTAHEQVMHSYKYAWISRRRLKRDYRKLWIARINAAARMNGLSYSKLMNGLKKANVQVNRKMLSEIAIADPESFKKICDTAKANLK
ncbi:MAG: 50S ribosomal protein L20 [Erysipelotrichaceae bacterium]|nr:50S ribosomal protein L20 [Erysipelotrichaceae bacterium]